MKFIKLIKSSWYRYYVITYVIMILTIFLLPRFSIEGYQIHQHTTSHLGAQNTPNAWIMNAVFILLSLGVWHGGTFTLKQFPFQKFVLYAFCISLLGAAIFRHAPINHALQFNAGEDEIHSIFASSTGFSFTLLATSFYFVHYTFKMKWLALLAAIISIILSLLFFWVPSLAGIWQRLIFIFCFGWLLLQFRYLLVVKSEDDKVN